MGRRQGNVSSDSAIRQVRAAPDDPSCSNQVRGGWRPRAQGRLRDSRRKRSRDQRGLALRADRWRIAAGRRRPSGRRRRRGRPRRRGGCQQTSGPASHRRVVHLAWLSRRRLWPRALVGPARAGYRRVQRVRAPSVRVRGSPGHGLDLDRRVGRRHDRGDWARRRQQSLPAARRHDAPADSRPHLGSSADCGRWSD